MSQPITVITTGGTVSLARRAGKADRAPGGIASLVDQVSVPGVTEIEILDLMRLVSHSVSFGDMRLIAETIARRASESRGIVVTHGTDTLEDSAYYVAESLGNMDVVFTGAMRPPDDPEFDGLTNLQSAIGMILNGEVCGTTIVMAGSSYPAYAARKAHTVAMDSFNARSVGFDYSEPPLRVEANWIGTLPISDSLPRVEVEAITVDQDRFSLVDRVKGADGVVIVAFGTGSIPVNLRPAVFELARKTQVVLCTRCSNGPVTAESIYPNAWSELSAAGVKIENVLDPFKARTRLAMMIAQGTDYVPFRISSV